VVHSFHSLCSWNFRSNNTQYTSQCPDKTGNDKTWTQWYRLRFRKWG